MAVNFAQWGNDLYTGRRSYDIVGKRRVWLGLSALFVVLSVVVLLTKGLTGSIEFEGGSEFTVTNASTTAQQPAIDAVNSVLPAETVRVSTVGASAVRVQTQSMTSEQIGQVRAALAAAYEVEAGDVTSAVIGPSWGKDVSTKALQGVVVFIVIAMLFMTIYFRTWRMAVAAIGSLLQDLVITVGIYALVGFAVSPATVIGLMTILAYAIYDVVVVFDKVRENTRGVLDQTRSTYAERANLAVNQTMVRSINTSVVAALPVAAILFVGAFLLGAGTLRDISLALFIGIIVSAISSIFIATPLEVALQSTGENVKAHTARVLELRAKAVAESGEEPDAARIAAAGVHAGGRAQLLPGQHLGHRAQPRRKKK